MSNLTSNTHIDKEVILSEVLQILKDMTSDWETEFAGAIGPKTRLVADLTFESIDVVQLAVSIEEHFNRSNLPFRELIMTADGRYVDDVQVSDLVDFLYTSLSNP